MPDPVHTQSTTIGPSEMTGEQLALPESQRVSVKTRHGELVGGRVRNGCQVFLNVPYGLDVPRFSDPKPLPEDFVYERKEYIRDGLYCAQPTRAYTLQIPVRDRLGLGQPTENPFFADIYVPSHSKFAHGQPLLPVHVFLHGGFLQFGSTSGKYYNQQFFAAEHFGEIRVLLGHRVSVLGFLGCSEPLVPGNFGFKDCWLGLEWVRDNIQAFGGDPAQVHLSSLSGGGHIVGQLLHQAARLAPQPAPFVTALLQSNAILADPVSPSSRNVQFNALCRTLSLDPSSPDILDQLCDEAKIPTEALMAAVQSMGSLSTFRGVIGTDGWVRADEMAFQRSGGLAKGLRSAGVRCVIMGDVRDEIVHPCSNRDDVRANLSRYYPGPIVDKLLLAYPPLPETATPEECDSLLGRMLADGQVHLPVRVLAKDLAAYDFPAVRYAIEMAPVALQTNGKVPHGADLPVQHLRLSQLTRKETASVLSWHGALRAAVMPALTDDGLEFRQREEEEKLLLARDGQVYWGRDWRWPELRAAEKAVRD